jgi:hypothetical protein
MGDLSPSRLARHPLGDLVGTRDLVADLMDDCSALLPDDLRTKLPTFRSDLDAAIDDHGAAKAFIPSAV